MKKLIKPTRRATYGDTALMVVFTLTFVGVIALVLIQVSKLTAIKERRDTIAVLTDDRDTCQSAYRTLRNTTHLEVTASGKVAYYADQGSL